ncbi:NAD(P)-dependent oxidoreductase [Neptuniibacter pectenicola]|jgi:dTDP-glucose 4,6-dehydratase|uniref:NAD-dependent epimerase/dehydratase family protein n=1 Tax=Neptuniibacter pectenicola TaxID=1806669 RepID=UPI0030ED6923|tara:strand:+ start:272 stop:1306 length:1035 start_codon:yes stop_codon:yes gene_type:complete
MNNLDFLAEDFNRIGVDKNLAQSLDGKAVFITGASGFFGRWFFSLLLFLIKSEGVNCKIYLHLRDKSKVTEKFDIQGNEVELLEGDIRSLIDLPEDVNYILHLAGNPDTRFHTTHPLDTMNLIVDGTSSILKAASRLSQLENIVIMSSSQVYDTVYSNVKLIEDVSSQSCISKIDEPYSSAKIYSEALCKAAASEARLPVCILRPFGFCGAFQSINGPWAFNNFVNDAISGRAIKILGDGGSVRSLMYGADLAIWLLTILTNPKSGVFNIGSEEGLSMLDMAEKITACFSNKINVIKNASLTGVVNNTYLVPDCSKAKKSFDLNYYTNIDLSIERSVMWYKNNI